MEGFVCIRWGDATVGDATLDVLVSSSPFMTCKTAFVGSHAFTTRPSAALLLNKPFRNLCPRHRSVGHLFSGTTSIMSRRIVITESSSSSSSLLRSHWDHVWIQSYHWSDRTFFSFFFGVGTVEGSEMRYSHSKAMTPSAQISTEDL
jgi:hypothetical protein